MPSRARKFGKELKPGDKVIIEADGDLYQREPSIVKVCLLKPRPSGVAEGRCSLHSSLLLPIGSTASAHSPMSPVHTEPANRLLKPALEIAAKYDHAVYDALLSPSAMTWDCRASRRMNRCIRW
jgi:hypothetical protein